MPSEEYLHNANVIVNAILTKGFRIEFHTGGNGNIFAMRYAKEIKEEDYFECEGPGYEDLEFDDKFRGPDYTCFESERHLERVSMFWDRKYLYTRTYGVANIIAMDDDLWNALEFWRGVHSE